MALKKRVLREDMLVSSMIPDDDIRRVVKKLSETYDLESMGAGDFPLDPSVMPSKLGDWECLRLWNEYQREMETRAHPASVFPILNIENDIKVGKTQVAVGDKVYKVSQATVEVGPQGAFNAHCASVADMLATSYRYVDKDGFVNAIQKTEERIRLGVPNMGSINEVIRLDVTEKNPHQMAKSYYDMFTAKPSMALKMMTNVMDNLEVAETKEKKTTLKGAPITLSVPHENEDKNKPRARSFSIVSRPLSKKAYSDYVEGDGDDVKKIKTPKTWIVLPRSSYPTMIAIKKLDACYKMLDRSRAFRGEDASGVGAISAGYYIMKMPRNYAKAWSLVQDYTMLLRECGKKYKRLYFPSSPGPFKLSVLVANGFQCATPQSLLKLKDPLDVTPGVYMNLPDALTIRDFKSTPPIIKKLGITYMMSEDFSTLMSTMVVDQVLPLHLNPYMENYLEKNKDMGILPSSMPHNGIVYIGYFKSSVTFLDLVMRFSESNYHRNTFVYHRMPYRLFDKYRKMFDNDVKFPKTRATKVEADLYAYDESITEIDKVPLEDFSEVTDIPDDIPEISTGRLWNLIVRQSTSNLVEFVEEYINYFPLSYKEEGVKFVNSLLMDLRRSYNSFEDCHRIFMTYSGLSNLYRTMTEDFKGEVDAANAIKVKIKENEERDEKEKKKEKSEEESSDEDFLADLGTQDFEIKGVSIKTPDAFGKT
jgi:hypothetical protein